jgi:hypothetical protein
MAQASSILLGAMKDIQLDGGTQMVLGCLELREEKPSGKSMRRDSVSGPCSLCERTHISEALFDSKI